ncbi:aldehyde dehydrogenase (NADP(+)) [Alloacidobacterium dinghuense]|uniref:2,5-dioxovalerate dehydrogenase n=1 Tax=Alloacidobacterium dinghuense TaxID=2763107 RepID=A0A7G8BLW3_9BACT|nr:aldehyde dehydrogenase (NADP(+)) [Alloacidobacterium dinghuense]QNI33533.1 aldehyde dehydrogenase (NADP(+)) [Alloacidobacterium dinghuense]
MLQGTSFLGSTRGLQSGAPFQGTNPATGERLQPTYFSASIEEVDHAATSAEAAFSSYRRLSGRERGAFLRRIADGLQAIADDLVQRANQETALPIPRLQGEVARTANQLRLFADVAEEGSWVTARIDTADPERKPLPKPDIRSMFLPLGPVAVFGASNFPLAFSVAGGDTASALAAGNPVIVKAHPAHPGTSELVGNVIRESIAACGLHEGVFSLLFDAGIQVGQNLVQHPLIKAVGFTGSLAAGRALMDLAAARPDPIPCYTEMSSVNPVFILPGALKQHEKIAADLTVSYTLGAGQFCTKPGLVFLPTQAESSNLVEELRKRAADLPAFTMLTAGIAAQYQRGLTQRRESDYAQVVTASTVQPAPAPASTTAALFEADVEEVLNNPSLSEEIFGPTTLLVRSSSREQLLQAAHALKGHLTATLIGTEEDLSANQDLIAILERKVGRVIFNGYPTGVEVCHAMVHGGPYPATSDGRSTSVGSQAIFRFSRPVCYQNLPQSALPEELKNQNPLGILRMLNGKMTTEAIS